ncbi:MAG: sulfatase-like hydrolase/transferase, partial [Candidatus Eisenbacteria bacterium]|nr:sulfatase-like hydrolase/transferase [Candidatus Eisenbacteria bacterium]
MHKNLTAIVACALVALMVAALLTSCSSEPSRPNIVVVVLDTVRLDYTGPGGTAEQLTPALDELAAEGTVFTRAWSNAPWTVPSHA